jgi:hypothetical protein
MTTREKKAFNMAQRPQSDQTNRTGTHQIAAQAAKMKISEFKFQLKWWTILF